MKFVILIKFFELNLQYLYKNIKNKLFFEIIYLNYTKNFKEIIKTKKLQNNQNIQNNNSLINII